MLKSCKAAQSAYLDNGGIAAHESPAGPASCTIGPATRSRSSSVEHRFCGLLNGLFCCWLLLLWQCSRCPIWREPNCTARVGGSHHDRP